MTSNRELEKRIERHEEDVKKHWTNTDMGIIAGLIIWIGAISIMGCIAVMAHYSYVPQYTPASPCELGLMEWEEGKLYCSKWIMWYCYYDENRHEICDNDYHILGEYEWKEQQCIAYLPEKSCPSDVKIMVVKE